MNNNNNNCGRSSKKDEKMTWANNVNHGDGRRTRDLQRENDDSEKEWVRTARGHYIINTKLGIMKLPPEEEEVSPATAFTFHDNDNLDTNNDYDKIEKDGENNTLEVKGTDAESSNKNNDRIDYTTTPTTFRTDVRNDWVDAVFGTNFFPSSNTTAASATVANESSNDKTSTMDVSVRQITGTAGIPGTVVHGVILHSQLAAAADTLSIATNSNSQQHLTMSSTSTLLSRRRSSNQLLQTTPQQQRNNNNNTSTNINSNKLGMTISRIPLGLYVHSISVTSEAYAVGISPGSILVDINGESGDGGSNSSCSNGELNTTTTTTTTTTNNGGENQQRMGMLGERSDRALERLWQYEGLFLDNSQNDLVKEDQEEEEEEITNTDLRTKKPLLLRFYKAGRLYSTLLLSGKPLSGITWAPCGNYTLIQNVKKGSVAYTCGIRRGSLIVGINGGTLSLRTMDHACMARYISEKFGQQEALTLFLGYTPAASRSGYQEQGGEKTLTTNTTTTTTSSLSSHKIASRSTTKNGLIHNSSSSSSSTVTTIAVPLSRDVVVRSRSLDYSTAISDTIFACTGPGAMSMVIDDNNNSKRRTTKSVSPMRPPTKNRGRRSIINTNVSSVTTTSSNHNSNNNNSMTEVATYIAGGGIVPSGSSMDASSTIALARWYNNNDQYHRRMLPPTLNNFCSCPVLPPSRLFVEWDMLSSLARSMIYQMSGSYCESEYARSGGPFERIGVYQGAEGGGGGESSDGGSGSEAPFTAIESLGMIWGIANNRQLSTTTTMTSAISEKESASLIMSVEKVFDAHLLQLLGVAISPVMFAVIKGQRLSNMLLDIVIDVALYDINLCQRLYFLLRSFIGEFEEQRGAAPQAVDCKVIDESVHALRCCRYAQRRLSVRMFDKAGGMFGEDKRSGGYPIHRESTTSRINIEHPKPMDLSHLAMSPTSEELATAHTEDIEVDFGKRLLITKSSSEDMPATNSGGSSHENYDMNTASIYEHQTSKFKKSKSQKIIGILTGSSVKSMRATIRKSPSPRNKASFSFANVFLKQQQHQSLQIVDRSLPLPPTGSRPLCQDTLLFDHVSLSVQFENMAWILRKLDQSCLTIERNLTKTFSQKMTDWALSSWSVSKENALASATQSFRSELQLMNPPSSDQHRMTNCTDSRPIRSGTTTRFGARSSKPVASLKIARFPILNPVDPTELLTSIDVDECFILPSAHFPLLLCFNSEYYHSVESRDERQNQVRRRVDIVAGGDTLYRTRIEILGLRSMSSNSKMNGAFKVQCTIAGEMHESGVSNSSRRLSDNSLRLLMSESNILVFDTRSNWGHPKTLALKVSTLSKGADSFGGELHDPSDLGCGFVDLCPLWSMTQCANVESKTKIYLFDAAEEFDQHGTNVEEEPSEQKRYEGIELHYRISVEVMSPKCQPRKRLLLYKHGDDLRQELLAIQFIEKCNQILLSSGLDLKLKTFSCQPVGNRTGFIEWVRGTVPLSELCKTSASSTQLASSIGGVSRRSRSRDTEKEARRYPTASVEELGNVDKSHRWFMHQILRGLSQQSNGTVVENPIQDFLRSTAYDASAPYMVKKEVMSTYVKCCAGYCVATFLLGVGDRHLDNILIHQNGHLLHCDYSFILGQDPKTYLPMRITDEMIKGFGGQESDNYVMFLSFTGAAFLTLRRHNSVHTLLSHLRNMVHANLEDLSINQQPEEAILAMRGRFRLDLNDDDALAYIENVVKKSISSKMWRAVDVMHSLGKHF